MVFVRAHAYVHTPHIHGVILGSLCAAGDWLDVYKDRQREGRTNRRGLVAIKVIYLYL